jgi:7,8-dihydro-6-hydroxymethylpterin dimethyltransferase
MAAKKPAKKPVKGASAKRATRKPVSGAARKKAVSKSGASAAVRKARKKPARKAASRKTSAKKATSPRVHADISQMGQPKETHLSYTTSLCPTCLKVIKADIFERGGKVMLRKTCPEHGTVEDVYWSDYEMYRKAEKWARDGKGVDNPSITKDNPNCPRDCGLCGMHKSHTALANIVLTTRCDRNCFYCFFYAERLGYVYEPSMGQIREMLVKLRSEKPVPCNAVQLTGGEPTIRPDLLEIIRMCRDEGFDHVQLNTNGVRISKDLEFTQALRDAGVSTLYLSFDGVSPRTNIKNHWEIPGTLKNIRKAGIGAVLVPTVIGGLNDGEIGDILRFGFRNNDVIRGVNFQPVSLVGMMPRHKREQQRITIPDVIRKIEEQTNGQVGKEDFYPVPSMLRITNFVEGMTGKSQYDLGSHFACGMATYVFNDNGKMVPITRFVDVEGMLEYIDSLGDMLKSKRNSLSRGIGKLRAGSSLMFKINSFIDSKKSPQGFSLGKILYNALVKHSYGALGEFHHKSLFVGMMHFQDLYNYDIERVKRCCIHYAMTDGRIIPFCAFNVIPQWYRDKDQEAHGIGIKDWEKRTGKNIKDDQYIRDVKKLEASAEYKETYKGFPSE